MALQKQRLPISINAGIDTKTDAANVAVTSFLEAENITYQKLGGATKRLGYTNLTTDVYNDSALTSGTHISRFGNETVLTDANKLYTYASNKDKWVEQDTFRHFSNSDKVVINDGSNIFYARHASVGNTIAYVYGAVDSTPTTTYTLIIKDTDTDTVIYTKALSTVTDIVSNANGYYIVDGNSITFFNTTTLTESSPSTATRYSSDAIISDGTYLYTARAVSTFIQLSKIDQNLTLISSDDVAVSLSNAPRVSLSFEQNTTYLRCCIADITGGKNVYSFTRAVSNLATVGHAPVVVFNAINCYYVTSVQTLTDSSKSLVIATGSTNTIVKAYIDSTGAITSNGTLLDSAMSISDIALLNGKHYMLVVNKLTYTAPAVEQTVNCVSYIIETSDDAVWKIVAYYNKDVTVPYSVYPGTTTASQPATLKKSLVPINNTISSISLAYEGIFDFTYGQFNTTYLTQCDIHVSASSEISSVFTNNALLFNGAIPLLFDGAEVSEQGFISRPQITNITTFAGLGGFPNGSYQFRMVYSYRDNNGNIYRSAPSDIQTKVVSSTTESMKIYYSWPNLSLKSVVQIELYMTDTNGSLFYKYPQNVIYPSGPTYVSITYIGNLLLEQEELYTDGGALDNDSMEPSYHLALHKNRIVSVNSNRTSISYSQIIQPNTAIAFSDALNINLNSVGGKAVSVATLDNYIVIFKENAIYAITGEGPNNLGQQDDYGEPQFVTGDTGCQDRKTVVTMPQGVMFNSPKGIYLLSRSLTSSYIGAPVEAFNGPMLCSILMPTVNEVRFATEEGTTLTYDYLTGRWATAPSQDAISMTLDGNNVYNYLTTDGIVHKQSNGYTDNGTFVPMKITSAWISLSGLQNYERFYKLHILGVYKSPHYLKVSLAYNFVDDFTDSVTIDTSTLPSTDLYEIIIRPRMQKCTSFKFKIEDLQNGTAGESLIISNFAMELGLKNGSNKRAAGFNFGVSEG